MTPGMKAVAIFGVLLTLVWMSPDAAALCYVLRTPHVGYIPLVESGPAGCTAFASNGCSTYLHCPPGSSCDVVLLGRKPCTRATATVPLDIYTGGSPLTTQCCTNRTLLGPSPTATYTVPADTPGTGRCFIIIGGLK